MSQKVHEIPREDITIAQNRQRRTFDHEKTVELSTSIAELGLIHPIVVRVNEDGDTILIAGERRLKALEYLWNLGQEVKCGEYIYPEGVAPCIMQGEMDDVQAFEMELEENVRRVDLPWQEKAAAVSQLNELRRLIAEKSGEDPPTQAEVAEEAFPEFTPEAASAAVRNNLIVARHLDDPDVKKAKTLEEGVKIIKRKEELAKNARIGELVGATFSKADHTLLKGDCIEVMKTLPPQSFDVILTDPPYGMGADEFGDSGGKAQGAHFYDDSFEEWEGLMQEVCPLLFSLTKPQSHLYVFCDIENYTYLRMLCKGAGWKCFRTPIIWHNPGGFRAPWPDKGPQRRYQTILYAIKGDRLVNKLAGDVLSFGNDPNAGHPAQKPVDLLKDLLSRSIRPGDSVLDPFVGSGSTIVAAHALKCRGTGIERDDSAYGLAAKRIGELV